MELRHLRYFVALAENLSFTQAAEKVHITQSTLSHQIKQLEDELGCLLFDRGSKRVLLTVAGAAFLERVRAALKEVDEGVLALRAGATELTGAVRIGATQTFNLQLIPECLALFNARHPSVLVQVVELSGAEITQKLRAGELDVAVSYCPSDLDGLHFTPLYNEELVLVVGTSHPFANRRFVRMSELRGQRLVLLPREFSTRKLLDECFALADAQPQVALEMSSIAPMLELITRCDIAAIVSRHAVQRNDLRVIALESPTPVRTPGLLRRVDAANDPVVSHFADIVRSVSDDTSQRRDRA